MALFSNTTAVIRHYLSSAVGDLVSGVCSTTGATTAIINAPFLYKPNDYYNNLHYEVYVYAGTNLGEARWVKDWTLTGNLLEIETPVYDNACDATSYIELHKIFTAAEYLKAINLGIESMAGNYLIDIKDETTITLSEDTYEYALPLSMLYLYRVIEEEEATGGEFWDSDEIDPRDYSIIKSYAPKLKLNKSYYSVGSGRDGKDLRLEGQGTQPIVDDDADVIYLPPNWLVAEAILRLPRNKIESNKLDDVFKHAEMDAIWYRLHARNWPHPKAKQVVE